MGEKSRRRMAKLASLPPRRPGLRRAAAAVAVLALCCGTALLFLRHTGYLARWALRRNPPRNLLLITIDTTRADHLGCYGYALPTTPNLDRLAASGVLFEQAQSTAPLTLPSHSTILTGLYPFHHGVRNNGDFYLPQNVPTLATLLKQRGFSTAAFLSSFILDSRYGLSRGFDVYDDHLERKERALQGYEVERKGGETTELALKWLSSNAGSPFFLWVHLYDPHETYDPPEPFRSRFASPYDGEIAYADDLVGSLIGRLDDLGVRAKTLVVVVGDHGESLGEHDEETHSIFIYHGTMHVPLILSQPGALREGVRVARPVSIADVFSTTVELFDSPPASSPDGWSLVPLLSRPSLDRSRPLYFESMFPKLYLRWAPLRGLRDGPWDYIEAPRPELYRVDSDPAEKVNLSGSQPELAARMRTQLRSLAPEGAEDRFNRQSLDDETISKLAGLGYIGAAAYAGVEGAAGDLPDPKDKIDFFNKLRDAQLEIRAGRFERAVPMLEAVVRTEPDNAVALLFLASGYLGQADYGRAIETYRGYLKLIPSSAYAHHWIAIASIRRGDQETALREEDAALAVDPKFVDSYVMKGGLLASIGRYAESVRALQQALAIDDDNTGILNDLGKVYMEWGRKDEARQVFSKILTIDAQYAPAWTSLGVLEAMQGGDEKAIEDFRKALAIAPGLGEARIDLARSLAHLQRYAEARQELETFLRATERAKSPPVLAMRQAALEALAALR